MVLFESFGKISYSHPMETIAVSCIVLETTAEIEIFFIPLAFDGLVRGSLSNYRHTI